MGSGWCRMRVRRLLSEMADRVGVERGVLRGRGRLRARRSGHDPGRVGSMWRWRSLTARGRHRCAGAARSAGSAWRGGLDSDDLAGAGPRGRRRPGRAAQCRAAARAGAWAAHRELTGPTAAGAGGRAGRGLRGDRHGRHLGHLPFGQGRRRREPQGRLRLPPLASVGTPAHPTVRSGGCHPRGCWSTVASASPARCRRGGLHA